MEDARWRCVGHQREARPVHKLFIDHIRSPCAICGPLKQSRRDNSSLGKYGRLTRVRGSLPRRGGQSLCCLLSKDLERQSLPQHITAHSSASVLPCTSTPSRSSVACTCSRCAAWRCGTPTGAARRPCRRAGRTSPSLHRGIAAADRPLARAVASLLPGDARLVAGLARPGARVRTPTRRGRPAVGPEPLAAVEAGGSEPGRRSPRRSSWSSCASRCGGSWWRP